MLGFSATDAISEVQTNIMDGSGCVRDTENRSTNVVISGIAEDRDGAVWRSTVESVLRRAASSDVAIRLLMHCGLVEDLLPVRQDQSLLK